MRKHKYLIALNSFVKFGPHSIKKLHNHFSGPEEAFGAGWPELVQAGLSQPLAREFAAYRETIDPDALLEDLEREHIKITAKSDNDYPLLLKEIHNPPPLLYYRGVLPPRNAALAVVGTRKFSSYGQRAVYSIVGELARNGLHIISGLALGIDTLAHNAALEAGGGTTAVLGTGIDDKSIYPRSNFNLGRAIIESGGCLLSEFPPGTEPARFNFPQRNRVISGLSRGVLVVEAAARSGALITARCALEQNREVFAVPGDIFSRVSEGPNRIIKEGAQPALSAADIFEGLDLKGSIDYSDNNVQKCEGPLEEKIYAFVCEEPRHIDEITRYLSLSASECGGHITMLEIKGLVKNIGGQRYAAM